MSKDSLRRAQGPCSITGVLLRPQEGPHLIFGSGTKLSGSTRLCCRIAEFRPRAGRSIEATSGHCSRICPSGCTQRGATSAACTSSASSLPLSQSGIQPEAASHLLSGHVRAGCKSRHRCKRVVGTRRKSQCRGASDQGVHLERAVQH